MGRRILHLYLLQKWGFRVNRIALRPIIFKFYSVVNWDVENFREFSFWKKIASRKFDLETTTSALKSMTLALTMKRVNYSNFCKGGKMGKVTKYMTFRVIQSQTILTSRLASTVGKFFGFPFIRYA